jgi:hypothetical protein
MHVPRKDHTFELTFVRGTVQCRNPSDSKHLGMIARFNYKIVQTAGAKKNTHKLIIVENTPQARSKHIFEANVA